MTIFRHPVDDHRIFLTRLRNDFLQTTIAEEQCTLLEDVLGENYDCSVKIWLKKPFYPISGQTFSSILTPTVLADNPILKEIDQTLMPWSDTSKNTSQKDNLTLVNTIAYPLVEKDNHLGIISFSKSEEHFFKQTDLEEIEILIAEIPIWLQLSRKTALTRWLSEQINLVRTVSGEVANLIDLEVLYEKVTQSIFNTFDFYHVALYTVDSQTGNVIFQTNSGEKKVKAEFKSKSFPTGKGIIGHVAQTGKEIIAPDVWNDSHFQYYNELPNTRSEAALPLRVENRILGVLDFQSDVIDDFQETDMIVLRALADSVAIAIEGANLYANLQVHLEQKSIAFEISHAINSILDIDKLLSEVVRLIQKHFSYPIVHIFTIEPVQKQIVFHSGSDDKGDAIQNCMPFYDIDDPIGIVPLVARTQKTQLLNDVSLDPRYRKPEIPPLDIASELVVPLSFASEILGILDIQSDKKNAFKEQDIFLFEALAASISTAIRNAKLYQSEKWRSLVADSFREVAGMLPANVELTSILDTILTKIDTTLPCDAAAIWLLNPNNNLNDHDQPKLQLAVSHGVKAEEVINYYQNDAEIREWLESALANPEPTIRHPHQTIGPLGRAMGVKADYSSIAAPLLAEDKPVGLITLVHATPGRYGISSKSITATFASYAAIAIQNQRWYEDSQRQAWISTVLLQVAEASQASDTIDDLLSTTIRITPLLVGLEKCAIFLYDEINELFQLKDSFGFDFSESHHQICADDIPAFARLKESQKPIFIDDPKNDLLLAETSSIQTHCTTILLPLETRGIMLGAFLVVHEAAGHAGRFDPQTLAILQGIARQTSMALENLKLEEARLEEGYVTAVLLQVAEAVAQQNELEDILRSITHLMPILVGIETCQICLWNQSEQRFSIISQNKQELQSFDKGEFELIDAVLDNKEIFFSPLKDTNIPDDKWALLPSLPGEFLSHSDNKFSGSLLLGFPLVVKGEIFGVIIAKDTGASPNFRQRRMEILTGASNQIALAIQNERLNEQRVIQERMAQEVQLARQIQQTFLPTTLPKRSGWNLGARWITAREVGGDFYDIFEISENKLGLVIADVADKGMPAALYMTVTRTLIRANATNQHNPGKILQRVNNLLIPDAENGLFVTIIFAILDTDTGELFYANAGHNRPLHFTANDQSVNILPKGNMALGVMPDIKYENHSLLLKPNDYLLFFTDGVTEAFNPFNEPFGVERLKDFLATFNGKDTQQLLDQLEKALSDFRDGMPKSDDVTLLAVNRLP
jgi:serine phosphatase RsbU (regulator of sigma subunit)/putative methionine-R-sulfoxide reductase with GAF domain